MLPGRDHYLAREGSLYCHGGIIVSHKGGVIILPRRDQHISKGKISFLLIMRNHQLAIKGSLQNQEDINISSGREHSLAIEGSISRLATEGSLYCQKGSISVQKVIIQLSWRVRYIYPRRRDNSLVVRKGSISRQEGITIWSGRNQYISRED